MTPQQLKSSILQMAIQGKLVEQRSEEGMAEELYQQIQEKKQKLIKEGKIKKEKPLAEITEDEISFDIPDSWKWVRLGQCGCFERGSGIKKDETSAEGFPCVRYGQLYTTYKTRFSEAVSHVPQNIFNGCKKAHKSDILMALTGENEYDIALAVAYEGEEELAIGGDMTRFFNHCMNPLYLTYVLNSRYGILCKSKMATGNIIVHISNDKLATIPIPLPPLEEQNRIVAKIEELLPYVDRYAEAYEKLEQFNAKFPEDMKKSILQYAIQGKLVEQRPEEGTAEELYQQIQDEKQKLIKEGKIKKEKPLAEITDDEIPFDIPDTWKWVRVGETCRGFEYGTAKKSLESGKMAVLRMGNIQKGKIVYNKLVYTNDTEDIEKYNLVEGDLLFNRTNSKEWVGKTAIYEGDYPSIYAGYLVRFRPILLLGKYLNYVMQTQYYWSFCQRERSDAIGQSNINAQKLKRFAFPLPPLEEQHRIVAKIEELLPYCDQLIKKEAK